jgi:hypothetical protein
MLHRGFLFRGGAAWHVGKVLNFSYFGELRDALIRYFSGAVKSPVWMAG